MLRFACLGVLVFTGILSCTHSPLAPPRNPSAVSFSPDDSKLFFEGLWGAPQSSGRKKTAELLQKWVNDAAKQSLPAINSDKFETRSYATTKNVLQLTIDYLQSGRTCSTDQKIRLYRGVGVYQLKERNGRYVVPWSSWSYNSVLEGKPVPSDKLKDSRDNPFEDLTYKLVDGEILSNLNKNFRWDEIVQDHSGAGSGRSALVSTSLEWSVAREFANPYLLVLDVCPERALALFSGDMVTLGEAEIYLPLFVLPEEVTAVLKLPESDPFYELPSEYKKINAVTQAMRRNFFSKDLPFDVQYLTTIAQMNPISDAGVPDQAAYAQNYNPAPFYDLILSYKSGDSIEQWRKNAVQRVLQTKANPKVCKFAYSRYKQSGTYFSGKDPELNYNFSVGSIAGAKFDLQEFRQVQKWKEDFSDTIPKDYKPFLPSPDDSWDEINAKKDPITKTLEVFDSYTNNFDAVKIYRPKYFESYLRDCGVK